MPAYVREAVRRAEEERPGTSHIELPEDVARQQARRLWPTHQSFCHVHTSCVSRQVCKVAWAAVGPEALQCVAQVPLAVHIGCACKLKGFTFIEALSAKS